MTREQIKSKIRMSVTVDRNHIDSLKNADNFIDQIFNDHEAQLKAKDEEIDRIKEIINTSIEEIEYAIIKPQYAEVYLNNAIRFLKDNK